MSRWLCITLSSLLFLIMTAACGKAAPSADSGLAAGASGTPGTPTSIETADVATPTPVVTSTTPVSSSGPIRTADEAAARALAADSVGIYASENVTVKHVEWMTLGDAWAAIGEDPESVPTDSPPVSGGSTFPALSISGVVRHHRLERQTPDVARYQLPK